VERDGSETGWQAKYFFELGTSEFQQLKDSFENAVAKHSSIESWPRFSRQFSRSR